MATSTFLDRWAVLLLTPLGITVVGPFALPFTYIAATCWTWTMRRVTA